MGTVDRANNLQIIQTIRPDAYEATADPIAVDTSGFHAVTIVFTVGFYNDGNWAVYIEDSPDDQNWTIVLPDSGLLVPLDANGPIDPQVFFPYSSSDTDYTITADNIDSWINDAWWIGYVGPNRYVRGQLIGDSITFGGNFGMDVVLGYPNSIPTRLYNGNQAG